jgi:hypothetical protein
MPNLSETEIISRVNKSLPMNSLITIVLTDILRVITNKIRLPMKPLSSQQTLILYFKKK